LKFFHETVPTENNDSLDTLIFGKDREIWLIFQALLMFRIGAVNKAPCCRAGR